MAYRHQSGLASHYLTRSRRFESKFVTQVPIYDKTFHEFMSIIGHPVCNHSMAYRHQSGLASHYLTRSRRFESKFVTQVPIYDKTFHEFMS